MDAQTIGLITAPVVALTQVAKWQGLPARFGPFSALGFSALGVGLWVVSNGGFEQRGLFDYFSATLLVALAAAGVFSFTRVGAEAVAAVRPERD